MGKDEVSSLHSQAGKDKEAMEDYQPNVMGVMCSKTTSVETNQRFQIACMTPPTRSLQSSS